VAGARALLLGAAITASCATPTARWNDVLGAEWVLVRIEGEPPLPGTDVALTFGPGRLYGRAASRYGATYARDEGSLDIGLVASTPVPFAATPAAAEQESRYLRLLDEVDGWRIAHGRLELLRGGAPVLAFTVRSARGARS
jgi:heat shock protein HslJ